MASRRPVPSNIEISERSGTEQRLRQIHAYSGPDGTVKHIQAIRHPDLNRAGDVVQLVVASIDTAERNRAEEALRLTAVYLAETQRQRALDRMDRSRGGIPRSQHAG